MAEANIPDPMELDEVSDEPTSEETDDELPELIDKPPNVHYNGLSGIRLPQQIPGGCFYRKSDNKFEDISNIDLMPDLEIRAKLHEFQEALSNFNIDIVIINYSLGDYEFHTPDGRQFDIDIDLWFEVLYIPNRKWKLGLHVSFFFAYLLIAFSLLFIYYLNFFFCCFCILSVDSTKLQLYAKTALHFPFKSYSAWFFASKHCSD
jgi:hypothetical protein